MNNKYKIIILIFALTISLYAQSQKRIAGVVMEEDNKPLPYANVYLQNSFEGSMTNEEGQFQFEAKIDLESILIVSIIGYEKVTLKLSELNNLQTIKIFMKPTAIELQEAIVTGSSFSSKEKEGVTIKQRDVYTTPGGAADIYQSLKTMPGLTQVSESAQLYIRGGDPNEAVTIIDQATIYHPFTLESSYGGLFSNLNTASFENLYFSSGGFSVKYGNVLSGVLDIQTKDEPLVASFSVGVSLAATDVSFQLPIKDERLGIYGYAQQSYTKPLMTTNGIGSRFQYYPTSNNIGGAAIFRYSKTGKVKLYSMIASDKQGVDVKSFNYSGLFKGESNSQLFNIQHSDILYSNLFSQTSLSFSRYDNTWKLGVLDITSSDLAVKFRNDNELTLSKKIKTLFGFEFENRTRKYDGTIATEEYKLDNENNTGQKINQTLEGDRFGLYSEIQLAGLFGVNSLSFVGGARVDYVPQLKYSWQDLRATIGYKLGANTNLSLGVGSFHQLPDIRLYATTDGNPNLRAMQAIHTTFSLFHKFNKSFNARLELYNKSYSNLPIENNKFNYTNDGYGYAYGLDLIIKGKFPFGINGWISYGAIKTERKWMDFTKLTRSSFDITHNLTLVAKYNLLSFWQLGVTYKIATGRPFTPIVAGNKIGDSNYYTPVYGDKNSGRFKTYQRLDFRITYLNQIFNKYFTIVYLEALNILNINNIFGYAYNRDYSSRNEVASYFGQRLFVLGVQINLN